MRCAIYARYSSDLQRESSIEDQIRKCRAYAAEKGWTVLGAFIKADSALSGAAVAGRDALTGLVEAAKSRPRPFDRILVDDTSRLARNVADSLKLIEILRFHGVSVSAVSQNIDSGEKSARPLLTLHGMMDEQFLVGLADKVKRGQEGRVLKGLHPGGRCFGYQNVPIEDPSRPGKYGRPAVLGVDLKIVHEEAETIRRIFRMYADGQGLAAIAKTLNEERVPAPRPQKGRALQAWGPSSIREMLRNERYRGVHVWNRTEKLRNPETGRKASRRREKASWVRVEVPEWRIVPEELWNAAHARIDLLQRQLGTKRLGGLTRTPRSRTYLFSGLLVCGLCGANIVIVSGQGKRGYVKYGCPSHRYRGVCANKLTIRQDRLEEQLLDALETRILTPEHLERAISQFVAAAEERQRADTASGERVTLEKRRAVVQGQIQRLTDAIADAGHSEAILARLRNAEDDLRSIEERLAGAGPTVVSTAELRDFALRRMTDVASLVRQDIPHARAALQKHVPRLVLTPTHHAGKDVFDVSGGVELSNGGEGVMQVVARDGLEPPTPAFSGPRSTN